MPMSDFHQNSPPQTEVANVSVLADERTLDLPSDDAGFTLLEVLVVLTLMAFATMTVMPRLSGLIDSVSFAMARESFERELNGLSYQAYKSGMDLRLDAVGGSAARRMTPDSPPLANPQMMPARMTLPEGWTVTAQPPVIYRASGYCQGGVVVVEAGTFSERYILRPPTCQAEVAP